MSIQDLLLNMFRVHFCLLPDIVDTPYSTILTDHAENIDVRRTRLEKFISELASSSKSDILPGRLRPQPNDALDQESTPEKKSCLTGNAILNIPLVEKTFQ